MSSRVEHVTKAAHNDQFSLSLQDSPFTDWSVTSLFYSALHWVDASLDGGSLPTHPTSHVARTRIIRQDPLLRLIFRQYKELKDRSMDARYDCVVFTSADVEQLRLNFFEPLKAHIQSALP